MSRRKPISDAVLKRTAATWERMVYRCDDPTHAARDKFKGPAFQIAERWYDFEAFLADMGPRPGLQLLERIDKSRGYEPGNCRWSEREESPWPNAREPPRSGDTIVRLLVASMQRETAEHALWFWSV